MNSISRSRANAGLHNQHLGRQGEQLAARFLEQRGFRILARRFRSGAHEIDLVAEDAAGLVFVEVKARSSARVGDGMEAITRAKQRSMALAAQAFLLRYAKPLAVRYGAFVPARFGAVQLLMRAGRVEALWADNAFELPFDVG